MLRQRRYTKRTSVQNSLNIYSNQNFGLFDSSLEGHQFYPCNYRQSKRVGLTQILANNAIDQLQEQKQGQMSCKPHSVHLSSKKENSGGLAMRKSQQDQDNIFYKINELIRHEENGLPLCHSFKQKKNILKERPYTSLSTRNKKMQEPSLHKFQVVLDLTPKEQSQELIDPSKVSTSRALMNYSKVFRNSSGDRFKVKRDKQYLNHFSMVSAQRVVLKQKDKKAEKERITVSKPRRSSSRADNKSQNRYKEVEDEYQIEGWEYFD